MRVGLVLLESMGSGRANRSNGCNRADQVGGEEPSRADGWEEGRRFISLVHSILWLLGDIVSCPR